MKNLTLMALLGAVILSSCGGGGQNTPAAKSVSGTVVENTTAPDSFNLTTKAWTGGAGQVKLVSDASASTVLATGNLAANGTFAVTLPASVDTSQMTTIKTSDLYSTRANCTGNLNVSNLQAKGVGAGLLVNGTKSGVAQPLLSSGTIDMVKQTGTSNVKVGGLIYVDSNTNITGTITCTDTASSIPTTTTVTSNLKLVKGWNLYTVAVEENLTASKVTAKATLNSGALPTDKWVFDSGMSPLSLKSQMKLPKIF